MKSPSRRLLFIVTLVIGLSLAALSWAQGQGKTAEVRSDQLPAQGKLDKVAQRVSRLSDLLMSPYCKGKTLKTCTSPNAATLRRKIEGYMRHGKTDDQIIQMLTVEFPETQLINPEQPWYTFFVPFLPYILGAGALLLVLLTWRKGGGAAHPGSADIESLGDTVGGDDGSAERLSRLRARIQSDD